MPYIEEEWSEKDKALVMADEAIMDIFEVYNEIAGTKEKSPELIEILKKLKFPVAHAQCVNELLIRKSVSKEIWAVVDADAKKQEQDFKKFVAEQEVKQPPKNGCADCIHFHEFRHDCDKRDELLDLEDMDEVASKGCPDKKTHNQYMKEIRIQNRQTKR
jgi:hypothetical protein